MIRLEVPDLRREAIVNLLVPGRIYIAITTQHGLFRGKVLYRVLDQLLQRLAQNRLGFAGLHGLMQLLDDVEELAVLSVDHGNADGERIFPPEHMLSLQPLYRQRTDST